MRRVLVTGGCGFIGSHLVDKLAKKKYIVDVLDYQCPLYKNPRANYIKSRIDWSKDTKTSNFRFIKEIYNKLKQTDVIFHMASLISAAESTENPYKYFEYNLMDTIKLMEHLIQLNCHPKIILSSSAAVYGEQTNVVTETSTTNPISPYGLTKLEQEKIISMLGKQNNIPFTILRYFNVYGERQQNNSYSNVINIFADKIKKEETLDIYQDGYQRRDWIYVSDVVNSNLRAMEHSCNNKTFNIATGESHNLWELINTLEKLLGKKAKVNITNIKRKDDIKNSCVDIKKAKSLLQFKPTITLKKGCKKLLTCL